MPRHQLKLIFAVSLLAATFVITNACSTNRNPKVEESSTKSEFSVQADSKEKLARMYSIADISNHKDVSLFEGKSSETAEVSVIEETSESVGASATDETSEFVKSSVTAETSESVKSSVTDETSESVESSATDETSESVKSSVTDETSESVESSATDETSESVESSATDETSESVESSAAKESHESVETSATEETSESLEASTIKETSEVVKSPAISEHYRIGQVCVRFATIYVDEKEQIPVDGGTFVHVLDTTPQNGMYLIQWYNGEATISEEELQLLPESVNLEDILQKQTAGMIT